MREIISPFDGFGSPFGPRRAGGGGGTNWPVNGIYNYSENLVLDPPIFSFTSMRPGTWTWDFHSSATPPALGAGDIATGSDTIVVGANTGLQIDLSAYPSETGYIHHRVTDSGAEVSNTLTSAEMTTPAASVFTEVDNGASAYSRTQPNGSTDTAEKIVLAWRMKTDTIVAGHKPWGSTTAVWRMNYLTTSQVQFVLGLSIEVAGRSTLSVDTNWHTHVLAIDRTQAAHADGMKYWVDGTLATLTNAVWSPPANYEMGLSGANRFFAATTGFGIGGPSSGTDVFDGRFAFFWADWGGSGYSIPDFSNSAVWDTLDAASIGANGQGVTGSTPKRYYTGATADWNGAGLANRGTETPALIKQAGTWS